MGATPKALERAIRRKYRRRPRRLKRVRPRQLPKTYEARYYASIKREVVDPLAAIVQRRLVERLPELVEAEDAERTDGVRLDNVSTEVRAILERIFEDVRVEWGRVEEQRIGEVPVEENGQQVFTWGERETVRQFKTVLNIPIRKYLPDGGELLDEWNKANVELIESIPERYLDDVEKVVLESFEKGSRPDVIARRLEERYRVSQSRAKLIATDQVQKLNGQLQQHRQTGVGMTHYIWGDSRDERVRQLHRDRRGLRFAWDSPPEDGHPGQPVRCRCQALPDFDGWLEGLLEAA